MPIRIEEGADPLSEAARQSETDDILVNAQSEAGRLLRQELMRYCRGEINGRSFLVAGHRGAGKTTMVSDAVDRVMRRSRKPKSRLLRPLPVFLHGPSLFEIDADNSSDTPKIAEAPQRPKEMADQAKGALTQIILGLHRAVVNEFARAFRARVIDGSAFRDESPDDRLALAELAAQFEMELMGDPSPARLREFWAMAEALGCGVLSGDDETEMLDPVDRGALELVAVSGICEAYQRISGETSVQKKTHLAEEKSVETRSGLSFKGSEFVSPLVSVLSGVAVAGGTAAQVHSAGGALLAGLATALTSSLFFASTSTRNVNSSRQADTTFIPDLSLRTLDRVLPTLLQRLREAGLAPVLVVDELDKVENLKDRLEAMIHYLKKLVAENVFTCFLTDRGYLEQLRLERKGAYDRSYSYFSHALLVTFQPADLDGFLTRLLRADAQLLASSASSGEALEGLPSPTSAASGDSLDLEVLKWVLRHRCELHPLTLTREISRLRDESNTVLIQTGAVRTELSYRIALTFQVGIELQLAQPNNDAWLRLHPERAQTLIDALYFASRIWIKGDHELALDADHSELVDYLIGRMNLDKGAAGEEAIGAEDDRKLLFGLVDDLLECLCQHTDENALVRLWDKLPQSRASMYVTPSRTVLEALLLNDKSLLQRHDDGDRPAYSWRYAPSGLHSRIDDAGGGLPSESDDVGQQPGDALRRIERIKEAARILNAILRRDELAKVSVFELLAEQLRVLPTTPAWQPVSVAIANIELAGDDATRRASLVEDERVVREFLEMLDENAGAVGCALTMASYCVGAGETNSEPPANAWSRAMSLLSAGMGFERLDREGVRKAVSSLDEQARGKTGRSLLRRDAELRLDDPLLETEIETARSVGKTRLEGVSRQEKSELAWADLKTRLEGVSSIADVANAGAPRLSEFIAAAARVGPWRVLGIDLAATTLSQWTTAVVIAAELTRDPVEPQHRVPQWIYNYALERLGFINLSASQRQNLMHWLDSASAMASSNVPPADAAQIDTSGSGVLALCVAAQGDAMRAWTERPRLGLAFVATQEQAQSLINHALFNVVSIPAVVAVSAGIEGGTQTIKLPKTPVTRVHLVSVLSRDHQGRRPSPAIMAPSGVDDILDFALAVSSDEAKSKRQATVYVEPRPKARSEGEAIAFYVLEHIDGGPVSGSLTSYPTQALAIDGAKQLGHEPLVARIRTPDKMNSGHWRKP